MDIKDLPIFDDPNNEAADLIQALNEGPRPSRFPAPPQSRSPTRAKKLPPPIVDPVVAPLPEVEVSDLDEIPVVPAPRNPRPRSTRTPRASCVSLDDVIDIVQDSTSYPTKHFVKVSKDDLHIEAMRVVKLLTSAKRDDLDEAIDLANQVVQRLRLAKTEIESALRAAPLSSTAAFETSVRNHFAVMISTIEDAKRKALLGEKAYLPAFRSLKAGEVVTSKSWTSEWTVSRLAYFERFLKAGGADADAGRPRVGGIDDTAPMMTAFMSPKDRFTCGVFDSCGAMAMRPYKCTRSDGVCAYAAPWAPTIVSYPTASAFPQGWSRETIPLATGDAVVFKEISKEGVPVFAYSFGLETATLVVSSAFEACGDLGELFIGGGKTGSRVHHLCAFEEVREVPSEKSANIIRVVKFGEENRELGAAFKAIAKTPSAWKSISELNGVLVANSTGFADVRVDEAPRVARIQNICAKNFASVISIVKGVVEAVASVGCKELRARVDFKFGHLEAWDAWIVALALLGFRAPRLVVARDKDCGSVECIHPSPVGVEVVLVEPTPATLCSSAISVGGVLTKAPHPPNAEGAAMIVIANAFRATTAAVLRIYATGGVDQVLSSSVISALFEELISSERRVARGNELRGFFSRGVADCAVADAIETKPDSGHSFTPYVRDFVDFRAKNGEYGFCVRQSGDAFTKYDVARAVEWSVSGLGGVVVITQDGVSVIKPTRVFTALLAYARGATSAEDRCIHREETLGRAESRLWNFFLAGVMKSVDKVSMHLAAGVDASDTHSRGGRLAIDVSRLTLDDVIASAYSGDIRCSRYVSDVALSCDVLIFGAGESFAKMPVVDVSFYDNAALSNSPDVRI